MRIQILTIFPELFSGFLTSSLIAKSIERGLLSIKLVDIRDFAAAPHFKVDETPYGGGAGMVMSPEPLAAAIEAAKKELPQAKVILLSPCGARFNQDRATALSQAAELILVCGRYEGVDQRVIDLLVNEEISIGDFVVMGGEVPAMAVIEAVVRLKDLVVGNPDSLTQESFLRGETGTMLLEAPHYTRPPEFRGRPVPPVLLSGDHAKIREWREAQSLARTQERRPDLLKK